MSKGGQIRNPFWPTRCVRNCVKIVSIKDQIRYALLTIRWRKYYLHFFFREQIRHPLWPLPCMKYTLSCSFGWNQLRHRLWRLRCIKYSWQFFFRKGSKPQVLRDQLSTPLTTHWMNNFFTVSSKRIKFATPYGQHVAWKITSDSLPHGPNPPHRVFLRSALAGPP